jgi:hypothetical protein
MLTTRLTAGGRAFLLAAGLGLALAAGCGGSGEAKDGENIIVHDHGDPPVKPVGGDVAGAGKTAAKAKPAITEALDDVIGEIADEVVSEAPDVAQNAAEQKADDARCEALKAAWQKHYSNADAAKVGADKVPEIARGAAERALKDMLDNADLALKDPVYINRAESEQNLIIRLCGVS